MALLTAISSLQVVKSESALFHIQQYFVHSTLKIQNLCSCREKTALDGHINLYNGLPIALLMTQSAAKFELMLGPNRSHCNILFCSAWFHDPEKFAIYLSMRPSSSSSSSPLPKFLPLLI